MHLAPDITEAAQWDLLLLSHLEQHLSRGPLSAAVRVGPPDPGRKPTLQLFDEGARPVGYAKIGWSEQTRRLVEHEATMIEQVAPRVSSLVRVPRVLAAGDWQGRSYTIVEPLPRGARHRAPRTFDADRLAVAIARAGQPSRVVPAGRTASRETAPASASFG